MELTTSIAARLTGLRRTDFVCRVSVLSAKNRAFIRLHEVLPAIDPNSSSPLAQIIEKSSARPQEYEFFRFVAAVDPERERVPAPKLYRAVDIGFRFRNHRRYVIYVEHVDRRASDRSPETAYELAASMSAISCLNVPPKLQMRRALQLSGELLSQLASRAEAGGYTRDRATRVKLDDMVAGWPQALAVRHLDLFWVPAHNDLHTRNARYRTKSDGTSQVAFIDWEAFAWNYLGADLHHFVRESILQPERTPFFEALRSRYVEHVRKNYSTDESQVEIAAHAYALTRAMSRTIRKPSRSELYLTFQIYDRLIKLLSTL